MIKKLIPCFFIFVTSLSPVFGENLYFYHHPDIAFALQANKDPRFDGKIQAEERVGYGFSLRFFSYFGVDIAFRFSNIHPSSLTGGFQYRGYISFGPSLGIFGRIPVLNGSAAVRVFSHFIPQFASYYVINTSFFFLSMDGGIGLEIPLNPRGNWLVFASLPVSFQFRRDLAYSISPALSVSFQHRILPLVPRLEGGSDGE